MMAWPISEDYLKDGRIMLKERNVFERAFLHGSQAGRGVGFEELPDCGLQLHRFKRQPGFPKLLLPGEQEVA
jgi:hypothetical protein